MNVWIKIYSLRGSSTCTVMFYTNLACYSLTWRLSSSLYISYKKPSKLHRYKGRNKDTTLIWRTISAKNQTSHFIHNFSFDIQFFAFYTQLFKSHTIHFLFDLQLCQFYIQLRLQHNFSVFIFEIQRRQRWHELNTVCYVVQISGVAWGGQGGRPPPLIG